MAVWIALAVFVLCLVGGCLLVARKGLATWRQLGRVRGQFGSELERIADATAVISVQLDRAHESSERLVEARQRLAESRARLGTQLGAVREARTAVDRLLWFLPGR